MKKSILAVFPLLTLMLAFPLGQLAANATDQTWVVMHGTITEYGGSPVAYGWCGAYAKVGEWAKVHAFWVPTMIFQPPCWNSTPSINFTYSFYIAKLVNASMVELNYTEVIDFYISGIWDVYNVTFAYSGDWNFTWTMELMLDDANGQLSVTGNWTDFTIAITDIELISGKVVFHRVKPMKPIPMGDIWGPNRKPDCKVNIFDLVHAAKAYGSTPGNPWIPNYDFSFDFNFDYKIDIIDLTTIAVNIGESY